MARYILKFRRRRSGKTDYKKRLNLLASGNSRFVVRATNQRILTQVINYETAGDKVVASATSDELKKLGWKHPTKNLPAAYLTGLLCASRAKKKTKETIADIGLHTPAKGGRIFATIKGAHDGGIKISCAEDMFPEESRISGSHINDKISADFEKIKEKIIKSN